MLMIFVFAIRQNAPFLQARIAGPVLGATKSFMKTSLLRLIEGLWLAWEGTHGVMMWAWARRQGVARSVAMFQLNLTDIEMGRAAISA